MQIKVECYAGYRGEQEPLAFWLGERRLEAQEILDRWLHPDHLLQGQSGRRSLVRAAAR